MHFSRVIFHVSFLALILILNTAKSANLVFKNLFQKAFLIILNDENDDQLLHYFWTMKTSLA